MDRPLRWIFVISGLLALILWVAPGTFGDRRNTTGSANRVDAAATVIRDVSDETAVVARSILADSQLVRASFSSNPDHVALAFGLIADHGRNHEMSILLSDARQQPLAWTGRRWGAGAEIAIPEEGSDQRTVIERVGPAIILRTTRVERTQGISATVTALLAVDEPSVARLFGVTALSRRLSAAAGAPPQIVPWFEAQGRGLNPVVSAAGDTLATIRINGTTRSASFASRQELPGALSAGLFLISLASGWTLLILRRSSLTPRLRTPVLIGAVWATRYLLLVLGLPRRLDVGGMTDPNTYASMFGYGIALSPLDLLLSAVALWITVRLCIDLVVASNAQEDGNVRAVGSIVGLVLFIALPPLTRAYVVAMRSLVMDSSVNFYDPMSVVPSVVTSLLLVSALLLTVVILDVWRGGLTVVLRMSRRGVRRPTLGSWGVVITAVVLILFLFARVDPSGVLEWSVALTVAGAGMVSVATRDMQWTDIRWGGIIRSVVICAVALVTLDGQIHLKSSRQIEQVLADRMKPEESWLSFVLTNDLRRIVDAGLGAEELDGGEGRNALRAFRAWSASLMSRQAANSGVFLYNAAGKEIDRFTVGLSSFEQQTALHAVFANDEEVVQTVRIPTRGRTITTVGVWSTLRADGIVIGSVALILSPADDEPSLLASGEHTDVHSDLREVEYSGGTAVRSTFAQVGAGSPVPSAVREILQRSPEALVWGTLGPGDDRALFAGDLSDPEKILAIVEPSMDARWHLFHGLKSILVFALVIIVVRAPGALRRIVNGQRSLSFRARLFAVVALVTLVPIVLLVVVNQRMSVERTRANVEQTLRRDLSILGQRLGTLIESDEDIDRGVTDDFCASVASDLDIEFSFFRGVDVRASSRPELYASSVLDPRLPAEVFAALQLRHDDQVITSQRIGQTTYAVGFTPLIIGGRPAGVLAVPTLYRQREIEEDLSERNAFLLVAGAVTLIVVLGVGAYLSVLIARPLNALADGIRQVQSGRTPRAFHARRRDEVGEVMNAFDAMVSELADSRQKLARSEREQAWKEMAKQVAHEIKNPLTPIKLSVQHMRQAFKDQAPDREAILEKVTATILEQIDTLSRIATEFSQFARMPERSFQRVDVRESVQEAVALFRGVTGLQFAVDLPSTPAIVIADPEELRRVFVNVFRNSTQAMEDVGTISVRGSVDRSSIVLTVTDTGPGVPEELRSRIFEPRFSTKTEGMGLGLAIVRGAIEDLGGSIQLDPQGPGARFVMRLPIHERHE